MIIYNLENSSYRIQQISDGEIGNVTASNVFRSRIRALEPISALTEDKKLSFMRLFEFTITC